MKKKSILMLGLLIFSICLVTTGMDFVKAESKMIVVPDYYSTIQEAVDKATDGDIVLVKHGTYNGSVVINKRISLIGENKNNTVIQGDWNLNGTVVLVQHDNVILKNFTVIAVEPFGLPNRRGVHLLHVKGCQVSNCDFASHIGIWLYEASENVVENNRINGFGTSHPVPTGIKLQHSQDNIIINNYVREYNNEVYSAGISLSYSNRNFLAENYLSNNYQGMVIEDSNYNTIKDNKITVQRFPSHISITRYSFGISFESSANNWITGNTFLDCPNGIHLIYSSSNYLENNNISGSRYVGVELSENANQNQIVANSIRNNEVGANFVNSSKNLVYRNSFLDNSVQVNSNLMEGINFFDNGYLGNYWNNYYGADDNGNGIGDTPYVIDERNQDNYPIIEVEIIPEFQSWTPLLVTLVAVLFVAVVYRKKLAKQD